MVGGDRKRVGSMEMSSGFVAVPSGYRRSVDFFHSAARKERRCSWVPRRRTQYGAVRMVERSAGSSSSSSFSSPSSLSSRTSGRDRDGENKKLRISPRDFVVHPEYGIGKFLGTKMEDDGRKYAVVEYEDGFLTVEIREAKHMLSFYKARDTDRKPKLAKMGNRSAWLRTVAKARKSAKNHALNLIKLYSARNKAERAPYKESEELMEHFEQMWGHSPTEDQKMCFAEVKYDMCERDKPMDRLICGDVGFGKTEVAIRAAFRAVTNGRQVAILAPTTVLVSQHFSSFRQRMSEFGVRVGVHSRFVPEVTKKEYIQKMETGEIDVMVGTHGLLTLGEKFPNLGLLIIDEEQRFGVQQKESFKALRTSVDVLTLSATPIPRTMYMGLSGVRDMSLMRSPPPLRRPIKTLVVPNGDPSIEEVIGKELQRGGQTFYVTPRVKDLKALSEWLEKTFPEARTLVAHGKVKDLELRMHQFATGEADILLSTSIIESGIDIPKVNTVVVNRADMFGMAQLYQIRGRVGRSTEQAYAVFTYGNEERTSSDALRRLFAMEEFSDLGSAFDLAKRDLEIRGAGAMYGIEQSGTVNGVGVDLYMEYLRDSVDEWKIIERYTYAADPKILLSKNAPSIPIKYIADDGEHAAALASVHAAKSLEDLLELRSKWRKQYGPLPDAAEILLTWKELHISCKWLGIKEIRNVEGRHIAISSRMPEICWKKIIRDAFETPGEYCPKETASQIQSFLEQRCTFVESKGLVIRGLGGRPPSAQLRQLVEALRPLSFAAVNGRKEAAEVNGS